MMASAEPTRLLALPDSCLLAVMQGCADDHKATLSASRDHSRLHQAAVEALSSITAHYNKEQKDSVQWCLAKHGQHVHSLALHASTSDALQPFLKLPLSLTKLQSLQLEGMRLWQLQHGRGAQPSAHPGLPLTRLEMSNCEMLDGGQGLATMLMQLPDLQQLSVHTRAALAFPADVLTHLVQITCLRLTGVAYKDGTSRSSNPSADLEPLQALTQLADLQLGHGPGLRKSQYFIWASTLSGARQLTRLVLSEKVFEPRALAGMPQLQHLTLKHCDFVPGAGVVQLLSELQHLTQLTHLNLDGSCGRWGNPGGPSLPPAAYASLTASSRLQHLVFGYNSLHVNFFRVNVLPTAAWQYMCPPGRTLPQLRHLDIQGVMEADGTRAAPDTSVLVRCCPGLQSLATSMPCSTAQLAPLQRLSGLHTLVVGSGYIDDLEGVHALCQLTGLQDLIMWIAYRQRDAEVLQLTQLTRLTPLSWPFYSTTLPALDDDEHVWRQLLQRLVDSPDAEVAQQAAAGLAAA